MERLKTAAELISFLVKSRRWELLPGVIMILLFGVLMVGVLMSPVAPVIYPLF